MESSSNSKRFKIFGAVVAATALIALGIVALNGNAGSEQMVPMERAQAIATAEYANVPLSQVPDESVLVTPQGWQVESDEPVDGPNAESEEEDESPLEVEADPIDEDIDSPLAIEEDEEGQQYVSDELGEGVMMDADNEDDEEEKKQVDVAQDYRGKCAYNIKKKCGTFRKCYKKCGKKCGPVIRRRCRLRKYCKCFCKYKGNYKLARKCVVYKKKLCYKVKVTLCKKYCKKFCKKVRRCYCCPKRNIAKRCKKTCRKIAYGSKCGKCRCYRTRCYKTCKMYCSKYY